MRQITRTTHAQARMQQRAISELMINLVLEFGRYRLQKGGTSVVEVDAKQLVKLRRAVDKLGNVRVVLGKDDELITVMHGNEKVRSTEYSS